MLRLRRCRVWVLGPEHFDDVEVESRGREAFLVTSDSHQQSGPGAGSREQKAEGCRGVDTSLVRVARTGALDGALQRPPEIGLLNELGKGDLAQREPIRVPRD